MRFSVVIVASCAILISIFSAFYSNKNVVFSFYDKFRVVLLDGGGENCLAALKGTGTTFKPLGNQGTDICPVKNAVRITKFKNTTLSSSFILSCPAAVDTANWLEEIKAKHVTHMGTINCRKRRSSGVMSEHSFGLAIDISGIDGAMLSRHWNNKGQKGQTLRRAARVACKYFSNVLTPKTNSLHSDHFHFDSGIGFQCDV